MREFVDPYLYKTCVEVDDKGHLVYCYAEKPVAYDWHLTAYESIISVIGMMINGSYRFEFLFQTGKDVEKMVWVFLSKNICFR